MLIQFITKNSFSFKDPVTLCMAKSSCRGHADTNVVDAAVKNLSLLKSACIYGANASGKSNLLWSLFDMRDMVLSSLDVERRRIPVTIFKLNTEMEAMPAHFEVVFVVKEKIYRYGFEADNEIIKKEWLFGVIKTREIKYFERDSKGIKSTEHFKEGDIAVQKKTRSNVLFISVVAQFNGAIADEVVSWFRSLQFLNVSRKAGKTEKMALTPQGKERLMQFLRAADIGIEDVRIKTITENDLQPGLPESFRRMKLANPYEVYMMHKQYDKDGHHVGGKELGLRAESDGTQRLFNMFGHICDVLDNGGVLVVDELERNLHPLILEFIVKQFNCAGNKTAQLIFTTHDLSLLRNDLFRRDQIWFTEKNSFGSSQLFSLVEFKGIRQDTNFAKCYKLGKFKAIPVVDQFYRFKPEML